MIRDDPDQLAQEIALMKLIRMNHNIQRPRRKDIEDGKLKLKVYPEMLRELQE
jgi:hypothetical protein